MWSKYESVASIPPGYRFAPTDEELIFYLRNKVLVKSVPGEAVRDIDADELYTYPPYDIVKDRPCDRGEWYFFIHHDKYQNKHKEKENIPFAGNWIGTSSWKKEAFQERNENRNFPFNRNWIDKEFKGRQENENFHMIGNGIGKDFKEEQEKRKIQMIDNRMAEEFQQEERGKEKIRIVGNGIGCWSSVGKEYPIYDASGNVFAFKIHFIYFSGSIRRGKKTHWRMEEYHLVGSGRRGNEQYSPKAVVVLEKMPINSSFYEHCLDMKKEEWVLGRITRGRHYS